MQIVNTTILNAYTKIVKTILSCENLEQLKNCENYIKTIDYYSERTDLLEWKTQLNSIYFDKLDEFNTQRIDEVLHDESYISTSANDFKIQRFPHSDCIDNCQ
jgi:hypothetical protein